MRKQSQQKHEELIALWITRWKPRLLLDRWAVMTIHAEKDRPSTVAGDVILATMHVEPRYHEAQLTVYPALWRQPRRNQQTTIIHELCHIITHPLSEMLSRAVSKRVTTDKVAADLIEGITEDLAKITAKSYMRTKSKGYLL